MATTTLTRQAVMVVSVSQALENIGAVLFILCTVLAPNICCQDSANINWLFVEAAQKLPQKLPFSAEELALQR